VLSFLRQLTTLHCPHLLLRGRAAAPLLLTAGRAAIDRYLLAAEPTAANPLQRQNASDEWDRRMHPRTPDRCIVE